MFAGNFPRLRQKSPAIAYRGVADLRQTREWKQIIAVTPKAESLYAHP